MSAAVAIQLPDSGSEGVVAGRRRRYRAPSGLPEGGSRETWRGGAAVSFALHALVVILIVAPFAALSDITLIEQGAGGPGPAGGGGGGMRGAGVIHETLQYVTVAPPPAEQAPVSEPLPEIKPPEPQPALVLELPKLPNVQPLKTAPLALRGVGGGTGSDGTTGSGPGTGGGTGSGVGTERGSATGPGTGGGTQANYPPTAIEMFIPPMPIPSSVRGFRLVIQFDVDETGKVRGIEFTQTPDRGYNRRLREVFEGFRFRPGTRPDGTPIRMKFQMELDLP